MTFVSTALAVLALLFMLGSAPSMLALPRRWRMHWPVFAPLAGVAVLSLVTWGGVWAGLRISRGFALWSLMVPVLGAVLVVVRAHGWPGSVVIGGLCKHAGTLVLSICVLMAVAIPLESAKVGLTSVSLGSCDAADYAAGGRLLRDFKRSDLDGFNGQTEVVGLRSVDTFYGHWLRLNHFAPAGLIAWFSSLFGMEVTKLITVLGVALHAAAVPLAFWAARAGMGLGPWYSMVVAACWGCSAPAVYGVGQAALGQVLAAPAVVALTWAGTRAWVEGASLRGALRWAPLAVVAWIVVISAYSFAILFVLAPVAAVLAWLSLRERDPGRLGRALATGAISLGVAGVLFFERMAGLADRFRLFHEADFGWFIPVFSIERWYGWFGDAGLGAGNRLVGWMTVAVLGGAGIVHVLRAWHRDARRLGTALAWLLPIVAGYGILAAKGVREGNNEVYNAYKVFVIFQPLALAALAVPLRWTRTGMSPVAVALASVLFAVHWFGAAPVRASLATPVLWVDDALADLGRIEQRADIDSLNMRMASTWSRLWANALLLGKRQYFSEHTYEGRAPTALWGSWDLRDRMFTVHTNDADTILVNESFQLARRRGRLYIDVGLGEGWYGVERLGARHWSWSPGDAAIRFVNPQETSLRAHLQFGLFGVGQRKVLVMQDGREEPLWNGDLVDAILPVEIAAVVLPPGVTAIRFHSPDPPVVVKGDLRRLGFALYDVAVTLEVMP